MGGVVASFRFVRAGAVALVAAVCFACGSGSDGPGGTGSGGDEPGTGGEGGTGPATSRGGGDPGGVVPSATAGGGSGEGGESGTSSGPTTGGSGGQGDAASAGGASGGGGSGGIMVEPCPSDTTVQTPPDATLCDPLTNWGPGESVDVEQDGSDRLIAITPDELTLVWVRANHSGSEFRVADRSTTSEAFGAAEVVLAANVLAVSPDGLRVVVLSEDKGWLGELLRAARGDGFGEEERGAFAVLNQDAADNALIFGTAVIAPDDRGLYYTVFGADDDYPLHYSERSGTEPWPVGEPIESCELKAQGALARHPTGVSADGLTLFYSDAQSGRTRAAWKATEDAPFGYFVDLGARSRAQANGACDHLYYTVIEETSSLAVATSD